MSLQLSLCAESILHTRGVLHKSRIKKSRPTDQPQFEPVWTAQLGLISHLPSHVCWDRSTFLPLNRPQDPSQKHRWENGKQSSLSLYSCWQTAPDGVLWRGHTCNCMHNLACFNVKGLEVYKYLWKKNPATFVEDIELPNAGIERGSPTPMSGLTH